jgi:O-antigen/teichoic acid export membrane protein
MSKADSAGKVILRGARATASGFVVRFGARIAFLFIAARLFGVELFGAYTLAVAAVEVAVTIGGLGSKRILFKRLEEEVPGRSAAHVVLDATVMVSALSLALGAGFVLFGWLAPEDAVSPNMALALDLLAPLILGQALLDLFLAATRWTHAIRYDVAARSIIEPYGALIAVAVAWWMGWREEGLLLSYWVGTLAALAYAAFGLRKCLGRFDIAAYRFPAKRLGELLRLSSAATLNDLLNGLFARIDLYLVGIFLGEAGAGIYGMARQIRTPVRQVRQSFDGLLNPIIARTLAVKGAVETGLATASAARFILALQLPIVIGLVFAGKPLLGAFGPEFVAGYYALLLLATAEMIQGAFGVSDLIILYNKPLGQIRITASNIAINAVAGWFLIEPLGVTGAGLSVLAGVLGGALIRRHALRSHFDVKVPLHYSAGPVAAGIAALAAGWGTQWLLAEASPLIGVTAAVLAGFAAYAGALKVWLMLSGETLSMTNFAIEVPADGNS